VLPAAQTLFLARPLQFRPRRHWRLETELLDRKWGSIPTS